MRITKLFFVLVIASILVACTTTDLKSIDIASIDFTIAKPYSKKSLNVVPGDEYNVRVTVTSAGGKKIKYPNLSDFTVISPNGSFAVVKQESKSLRIKALGDSFSMISKRVYELELIAAHKTEHNVVKMFNIDWNGFGRFDYSGSDGPDGSDGSEGSSGSDHSESLVDGGDGSDGSDGRNGKNGKDLEVAVGYYNVSDLNLPGIEKGTLLLLYNMATGEAQLARAQNLLIDLSGGSGGEGGAGGDGGSPATYQEKKPGGSIFDSTSITIGERGKAGDGGDGGRGGDSGDLSLYFTDESILDLITPSLKGGRSGEGGDAGEGAGTFSGSDGSSGSRGRSGNFRKFKISEEEFYNKIEGIGNINIDLERVR